jgi:hypothetical protein
MSGDYRVAVLRGLDGTPIYVLAGRDGELTVIETACERALAGDRDALHALERLIIEVAGRRRPEVAEEEAAACVTYINEQLWRAAH